MRRCRLSLMERTRPQQGHCRAFAMKIEPDGDNRCLGLPEYVLPDVERQAKIAFVQQFWPLDLRHGDRMQRTLRAAAFRLQRPMHAVSP